MKTERHSGRLNGNLTWVRHIRFVLELNWTDLLSFIVWRIWPSSCSVTGGKHSSAPFLQETGESTAVTRTAVGLSVLLHIRPGCWFSSTSSWFCVYVSRPCLKKTSSLRDHNTSFTVADLKLLKLFCNHKHHCVSVSVITTACCTWPPVFFAIIISLLRK